MVSRISKPAGRKLAEFVPLKPAEQKLLDACRIGEMALISGQRPEQANDDNTVRASFLRFLALGGDEHAPVHEKGVRLQGAWVEDKLDLECATLPHSLGLINCHFNITPVLSDSVVHGFVSFNGSLVNGGLAADRMECSSGVFLNNFTASGKVQLMGVQIGGNLQCIACKLDVKDGDALICERAVIKGSVFLKNGFTATGTVRLMGTQIGGDLDCEDGKFDGKGGDALKCDGAVIKCRVLLRNGFTAKGTVSLVGAQIGGNLECDDGKFESKKCDDGKRGYALICDSAVIKGNVFLRNGFTATGTVRLMGAQIGYNLECNGATLDNVNDCALMADDMTVAGAFHFCKLRSVTGNISLVAASVGSLVDDITSWSEKLQLDGFVYDRLAGNAPPDAKSRLIWLNKQRSDHSGLDGVGSNFRPQPWRQLQKVLHEMGHVEDARQVAIAFEERMYEANLIGQTPDDSCKARMVKKISRSFHWCFGKLIGYGYRPLRLFIIMMVVWLVCGVFYLEVALYANNRGGVFAPSNPLVFQNWHYAACVPDSVTANAEKAKAALAKSACVEPAPIQGAGNWYLCKNLPEEYTGFSPLAYSLDLILPLVDLQQERDWAPMIPTPQNTWADVLSNLTDFKYWTRLVMWFEILFGWMSSLLMVAVVSGLTKRREE